MISKLPKWCLVNNFPAFYDFESLTATEQTARLYGKISELIESYNKYVEDLNKHIEDYEKLTSENIEQFIHRISCLSSNYINTVDMKIMHQNRQIAEVYEKFNEDVINTVKILLSEYKETGELDNLVFSVFEEMYQTIQTATAEMTSKMEELETDYQNTKNTLNGDFGSYVSLLEGIYNTTSSNLQSDYYRIQDNLESDYQTAKTNLENSVSDYIDVVNGRGAILYAGAIPHGTMTETFTISNLEKYQIVCVSGTNTINCLCFVQHINYEDTPCYMMRGLCGDSNRFSTVYLIVNRETGVVIKNDSKSTTSDSNEKTDVTINNIIGII